MILFTAARRPILAVLAVLLASACTATAAVPESSSVPAPRATQAATAAPSKASAPSLPLTGAGTEADATPGAAPGPTPSPSPVSMPDAMPVLPALDPPLVAKGRFEMDLYRRRDFVTEATKWYCVPAAMLTMINIMSKGAQHDKATQTSLYKVARRLSTKTLVGKGAEPIGWARGLEQLGYGGFEVGVHRTRREAIQAAANAIRLTGRPAGLLVWRGAHSWVMSGFRATRDPAATNDYTVTEVFIEDVWYPNVSSIWGASLPPDSAIAVADLKTDYLKWRRPTRRYPGMDGRFVTILPVVDQEP